ncbi:MAG: 2-hydroxyacid dehydrogenase [Dehalococcoidia bacterium]|nr:MAG: 2-hydroxyacid dehydrogenase [Dehalococcoidia bacterium]
MRIVVLEDWNHLFAGAPALKRLAGRAEIEVQHDRPADVDDLVARLRAANVVVLNRERTRLDAETIARLPSLELIVQTGGIGSNVDVAAASAHGVAVASAPGLPTSIEGVAELALGLLIALARRIPEHDRHVRAGHWNVAPTTMLHGGTMGIVGLGRLGRSLARIGPALGMRVIAAGVTLTPARAAESGAEWVTLDDLFPQADAVFICPRLTPETRGLVTRRHLASMRPTAYLINVARGPIVDEAALIEALRERWIAGAGLDVFDVEPLPVDHPFTQLDNVILTPHIGWVTAENTARFVESVVERITSYLDGDRSGIVNPEALASRRN